MPDPQWGERRATARQRARRRWIAGITAVVLASPFALHHGSKHYAASGGAMPDGRFPLWIPILYWLLVVAIAIAGVIRLYRTSDEFERRRLIDGFAVGGLLLGLLVPPLFFLDLRFGLIYAWLAALLAGLATFTLRRSTP
ncbi:hypothetical protein [Sphingomonas sp. Leaf4]|uniref:hypothetical protein n=1 Tax=Sphingomonas sp. Leaf4 TaxID=2876553 RepID=UPI001E4BD727|nr:hypothetical protein [Sphingomonas sp. Leaf4]